MPLLPPYFAALDLERMLTEHPIGEGFPGALVTISRDELRARQNKRFINCVRRGWAVAFYQRLWSAAGIAPSDVKALDDIAELPTFSKADLMDSMAAYPPFGDFSGVNFSDVNHSATVMHTTSKEAFRALLKIRIGVEMIVELHPPAGLAELTDLNKRQKPKRLLEERFKP